MKFHLLLPKLSSSRKARSKALTLSVIVGIVTFALATFGGKIAMGKVSSVVVAATDLQPGQTLSAKDLKTAGKISGLLPPGVYTSISQVTGLSVALPVKAGQPLVKGLVAKTPMKDGLYPGEVGVWVGVTLTTSGLVKPGDLVDVYISNGSGYDKAVPLQPVNSLTGIRVVSVVNGSAQPIQSQSSANNAGNSSVPAAVELAIPKNEANSFSQIGAAKVSLMLDPFATPSSGQTNTGSASVSGMSVPNVPVPGSSVPSSIVPNPANGSVQQSTVAPTTVNPAASNQPSVTQPNTNTTANTPVSSSNPVNSTTSGSTSAANSDGYTPPMFNPGNSGTSQNQ